MRVPVVSTSTRPPLNMTVLPVAITGVLPMTVKLSTVCCLPSVSDSRVLALALLGLSRRSTIPSDGRYP